MQSHDCGCCTHRNFVSSFWGVHHNCHTGTSMATKEREVKVLVWIGWVNWWCILHLDISSRGREKEDLRTEGLVWSYYTDIKRLVLDSCFEVLVCFIPNMWMQKNNLLYVAYNLKKQVIFKCRFQPLLHLLHRKKCWF